MKILINSAAAVSRNQYGAIEHYRNFGPYDHMIRYMGKDLELHNANTLKSDLEISNFDTYHFQNPATERDVQVAAMCKKRGLKVIADFDDDLINLPVNNHNFEKLAHAKQHIQAFMEYADAVTVSTHALEELHSQWCDPVRIPNCWYPQRQPVATQEALAQVMWRGSQSHADDIVEFQNEVVDLIENSGTVRWVFWTDTAHIASWTMDIRGVAEDIRDGIPKEERKGRWLKLGAVPMEEYLDRLVTQIRPMVTIVPLKDYAFNHAKSNIAWIEATLAGGVAVCPDWKEWQNKGSLRYKNRHEFKAQVRKVLDGKVNIVKMRNESMKEIEQNYNLDKWNLERWKVIDSLVGK